MKRQTTGSVSEAFRSFELWLAIAMFVVAIPAHYPEELLPFLNVEDPGSVLGLERHAIERVFMLLPITYVGFLFGMRAGLAASAMALAIMLPRALVVSDYRSDALVEVGGVIAAGAVINVGFERVRRERLRREEVLSRLQAAQQQLRSQLGVIQMSERQLAAVNAISNIVSQSLELRDVLNLAADKVMEVANLETILVFLVDEATDELVLETYRGISEESAAGVRRMKVGEGFNGQVAQTGEPLVVEDASRDPRLTRAVVRQEGIQAQLIVPLKSKGKVLGTLCVAARHPRRFATEEMDLLCAGGNVIAIAVENARLYQEERLMAEQLRISEKNYRDLFESAEDAIWVQDLDGEIIMANEACVKLTGYSREELTGMNVEEFLSGEALQRAKEVRRRLLIGGMVNRRYEGEIRRKDGSQASLSLSASLIAGDGGPKTFQLIARDITEEKRMHENLRFYLQQVTKAQEEERKRIARELHDETAQELVALSRQLDSLISESGKPSKQQIKLLDEIQTQVDKILEGVRRFSQDLRPSVIDDLGLLPALEWLISELEKQFGITIGIAVLGSERRFSAEVELVLFRVAQEALRNVWKHSGASRAWVTVEFGDDKTTLSVRDNGNGFEVPRSAADLANVGKLGLAGMEERARLVDGRLTLESEPGKGTTVTVEVSA
ncbi:MAG: PAS domain S-box protein [Dehalococcoidia bacterium]|nr:MAG: PAS domain S-box protein [Dehalococcoidia bacterium]